MGYVQEKYTEEYFLHRKQNPDGSYTPVNYGVLGIEEFNEGKVPSRIVSFLKDTNFQRTNVLDIGFGRGEAIKYARDHGAKCCFGIDFSSSAVKIAKDFLSPITGKCPIILICSDIIFYIGYFANNSMDVVIMLDVIEHIPRYEAEEVLAHVNRILCKDGSLIIETPFYSVDEDIIEQKGIYKQPSETDIISETKGMHCNKFTEKRFYETLERFGFVKQAGTINTFRKER